HLVGGDLDLPCDRARRLLRHLLCFDRNVTMAQPAKEIVLRARDVVVTFGQKNILDQLNLDVYRGEVLGFVGGSGAGKSVLMRTIIGLIPKRQGSIEVFGQDLDAATEEEL